MKQRAQQAVFYLRKSNPINDYEDTPDYKYRHLLAKNKETHEISSRAAFKQRIPKKPIDDKQVAGVKNFVL